MTIIAQPASTSISLTPDKRVSVFFIDTRVIYRHDTAQIILRIYADDETNRPRIPLLGGARGGYAAWRLSTASDPPPAPPKRGMICAMRKS